MSQNQNKYESTIRPRSIERGVCQAECQCQCHRTLLSQPIKQALGSMLVTHAGSTYMFGCCDVLSCKRHSSHFQLGLSYMFPCWLLQKEIVLKVLSSPLVTLAASISIKNVIPQQSQWITAIRSNDALEVQRLIRKCPARVNDVDEFGQSSLEVRSHSPSYNFHFFPRDQTWYCQTLIIRHPSKHARRRIYRQRLTEITTSTDAQLWSISIEQDAKQSS